MVLWLLSTATHVAVNFFVFWLKLFWLYSLESYASFLFLLFLFSFFLFLCFFFLYSSVLLCSPVAHQIEWERADSWLRERDAKIKRRRREEYGFQRRSRKKSSELAKALLSLMADLCNPIPFFFFFFLLQWQYFLINFRCYRFDIFVFNLVVFFVKNTSFFVISWKILYFNFF